MTHTEFNRLAKLHRPRLDIREACRLVLVEKLSGYAASQKTGVQQSTISRALKRFDVGVCLRCGQAIKIK